MVKHSKLIDYEETYYGLVVASRLSTDIPFIIQCNSTFGIRVILWDETIRPDINWETLDPYRMVTYCGYNEKGDSRWVVYIPTIGGELISLNCDFGFQHLSVHYKFSEKDFPEQITKYRNIAIITGFPE